MQWEKRSETGQHNQNSRRYLAQIEGEHIKRQNIPDGRETDEGLVISLALDVRKVEQRRQQQ